MFYIPNLPYSFYLAVKAKNPVFFTATNPAIKNSGNGMESKFETIQLIPEQFRPKTILVKTNTYFRVVTKLIVSENLNFPLIVKPDIGFRGILVKKINAIIELETYLREHPIDIIIQEFINYPNECGIFYHRLPNKKTGRITSITLKKFSSVIGDGKSTLSELIIADKRAYLYYDLLLKIHQEELFNVPKYGEEILLTVIGNHSKGTQFIDGNYCIDEELTEAIDKISQEIDGWFYGRLDIKYESLEKLKKLEDLKILEINGIISEPTHIYDSSKNSYFGAVKSIGKHWKIIYKIATKNHREFGVKYTKTNDFLKEIIRLRKYSKKLKKLSL